MKVLRTLALALLPLLMSSALSSQSFTPGTWTKGPTPPSTSGVGHTLLLTDGSVLAIDSGCNTTGQWYRLVPDSTGSYVNGKWVSGGTLPAGYNPLYFASAVLPSGNVIVVGGEYNGCNTAETRLGAMYLARGNRWVTISTPAGWSQIGDAEGIVLANGKFMLGNCCGVNQAIATVTGTTVTWTLTGTGKADANSEETWTLLPNNKVLAADANNLADLKHSELYTPSTGTWTSAGSTVVQLDDTSTATNSHEIGPAILRPDGTVLATGATGNNAVYNTTTGAWSGAPSFIGGLDIADGPAALLPDGNVLVDTSKGVYQLGTFFFEWDGTAFHGVPRVPNAAVDSSYYGTMLVLPTGQILFTDFSSDVEIYTPAGSPYPGAAAVITSVASTLTHGSLNNVVKGTQLNGLSQGSSYGDDGGNASNYPLVRITDATGKVVFCRTHNFSTMGVATGSKIVSAQFDVPSAIALGAGTLEVVTNGIASTPLGITIQ